MEVQVILNKSQRTDKNSSIGFLTCSGIVTIADAAHAIAHNKVMVIDNETVITGSFNFTRAAEERNAENLLIIRSIEFAARYVRNWQDHQLHSTPSSAKAMPE